MMKISFTYGSLTVDLQANGCKVLDGYYPKTAEGDEERLTEEMQCLFVGTEANAEALLRDLQRLFQYAWELADQENPAQIPYFNFAIDDDHTAWKSRIYKGRIGFTEKLDNNWRAGRMKFGVFFERDAFWEGAEVQLPLTNGNGTDNTSGLNVYNCNDGIGSSPNKRNNWVKIKAADMNGDLMGPIRLYIDIQTVKTNEFFIAHWVDEFGDGQPVTVIEGEILTNGTVVGDSSCSGLFYTTIALPTTWPTIPNNMLWINNTEAQQFIGRPFRVMARFQDEPPDGTWMKISVNAEYETPPVRLGIGLTQNLGLLQIPSYWTFHPSLYLIAYNPSGGTLKVDVVYLLGVDGYVHLKRSDSQSLGTNENVTLQWSPEKIVSTYNTDKSFFDIIEGNGIYLRGGKDQWLYFLMGYAVENDQPDITDYVTLKAYYRPRRRSL